MTIINRHFKKFFDITKLQELYPYKSTQELELIKNYCCQRTIHYIHILQGKIKNYEKDAPARNINFPFRKTIKALDTEKERTNEISNDLYEGFYEDFYNSFIHQLKFYKGLHDNNDHGVVNVYENISIFSTLIYDLLEYVRFFYTSG